MIQFPYKVSSHQQFRLIDLNNGYWSLKAMHCSHAVDVACPQQEVYGDGPGKLSPRRGLSFSYHMLFWGGVSNVTKDHVYVLNRSGN